MDKFTEVKRERCHAFVSKRWSKEPRRCKFVTLRVYIVINLRNNHVISELRNQINTMDMDYLQLKIFQLIK